MVKDQAKCDCPLAVTMIYFPVCGTDGQTYASEGVMQAQACQQNKMIAVAKVGKCGKYNFNLIIFILQLPSTSRQKQKQNKTSKKRQKECETG